MPLKINTEESFDTLQFWLKHNDLNFIFQMRNPIPIQFWALRDVI